MLSYEIPNKDFYLKHFAKIETTISSECNSYDNIYRGGYPLNINSIRYLKSLGIDEVIDLRSESSNKKFEEEELQKLNIKYTNIKVKTDSDNSSIKDDFFQKAYEVYTNNDKKYYIHCQRGEDRTGVFIWYIRSLNQNNCNAKKEFINYGGYLYKPLKVLIDFSS